MSSVNKVILLGRVGKDPESRTAGNNLVVNFSLATSKSWKDKDTGERKEKAEWHNIVLWRKVAEIAEKYVKKGDMIYIEGELQTRSWEKDGVTRYTTEILGNSLQMLSSKNSQQATAGTGQVSPAEYKNESQANGITDDLPF